MQSLAFHRALDAAWRLVAAIDGYIVAREPWKMFKQTGADEALSRVLWNLLEATRVAWVMVAPFMPATTREALSRIGSDPDAIGVEALTWGKLPTGVPVRTGDPIFPNIDPAAYIGVETKKTMDETKPTPPPIETTQAAPPDLAEVTIDQFMEL